MSRAPRTTVYTDGACQGNPGPGGWAWAVPAGPYRSGAELRSTNQRMEIRAALEAVTSLEGPLDVVSDSTYVVNCFRDRWWEAWLANGWLNKAKKAIANRDLWEPLIDCYRSDPGRLQFRWVKGHGTDPMNDIVDRLAVEASLTQTGRHGTGTPEHLGPQDRPRSRGADPRSAHVTGRAGAALPDPSVPAGRLVVVTGLKPPDLGGYRDNPVAEAIRARLAEILAAKRELHPDLTVMTGLGLGAEQLGAEAAAAAGVPYVAVLAFPGVEQVWPEASRERFNTLLGGAKATIILQHTAPDSKQAAGGALARRDDWLARHADEAIAVWDERDRAVGRVVRSLQDHLGEDEVWVIGPGTA
ncbi:MAG TPA: ribonuclease H [Acidimicrobiales bacterium]|nr:ribonuclease H [Acidimicrobiales bacterium]